jgi:hypothetical protein
MRFHALTLVTLITALVHAKPIIPDSEEQSFDLESDHAFPREVAFALRQHFYQKRVTSIPNLVPTTTVDLNTDSTGTGQLTSPVRYGATTVSLAAGATPVTSTGATATGDVNTATTLVSTTALPSVVPAPSAGSGGASSSAAGATNTARTRHHGHHTQLSTSTAAGSAPASTTGAGFQGSQSSSGLASSHGPIPLVGMLMLLLVGL